MMCQREKTSRPAGRRSTIAAILLGTALLYLSLAFFSERRSFGSDADGGLVAYAALRLAAHEPYTPSRLPGFPVFEKLESFFISPSDARAAKCAVALCSTAVIALFIAISLRAGGDRSMTPLVGLLLAIVPVYIHGSFILMDFTFSLLMVLVASIFLSSCASGGTSRAIVPAACAGAALSLAIGARISAVFFLPAAVLVVAIDKTQSARLKAAVIAGLTVSSAAAFFFYKPLIDIYGTDFLSRYYGPLPLSFLMKKEFGVVMALCGGLIGLVAAGVLVAVALKNLRGRLVRRAWTDQRWGVRALFIFAIVNSCFYALNPNKAAYHLPLALCFALIAAIGLRRVDRWLLFSVMAVFAASSFVQVIPRNHRLMTAAPGFLVSELREQEEDKALYDRLAHLVDDPAERLVVFERASAQAWFYGRARIVGRIVQPSCFPMLGGPPFFRSPVFQAGGCFFCDPELLHHDRSVKALDSLLRTMKVNEVLFLRLPGEAPLDKPDALCASRNCREAGY
jgi:hypothetical protein